MTLPAVCLITLKGPKMKIHVVELGNRIVPDGVAYYEPPHLYLHYLPSSFFNSQYEIAWGTFIEILQM